MKKLINHGFFCQEDVNAVASLSNLETAKKYAMNKINEFSQQHPGVHPDNITKAEKAVSSARSLNSLLFALQNFVLAHPSEGLRVI